MAGTSTRLNLFTELEMWMFCTTHFFRFHVATRPARERVGAKRKDHTGTLEETNEMLQRMEYLCGRLIDLETRRGTLSGQSGGAEEEDIVKQHQVLAQLGVFQEAVRSFRVLIGDVLEARREVPYETLQSFGRLLQREMGRFRSSETFKVLQHHHFNRIFQPVIESKILPEIIDPKLRFEVHDIFLHLFRLLCYLDYCGERLKRGHSFKSCVFVLSLLQRECGLLQRQLRLTAQVLAEESADQQRVFQMALFGLKLEARKVFRRELTALSKELDRKNVFVKIEDSCGLLRNSLENSFIALAQGLNPRFNKHEVFADLYTRYEQSVDLLAQLKRLREELTGCETIQACQPHMDELKKMLEGFERSSLRHLMIKDWMEFRKFSTDLNSAASPAESLQIAHRFLVYVDTLIGEVAKRNVLREVYEDDRGLIVH